MKRDGDVAFDESALGNCISMYRRRKRRGVRPSSAQGLWNDRVKRL